MNGEKNKCQEIFCLLLKCLHSRNLSECIEIQLKVLFIRSFLAVQHWQHNAIMALYEIPY